jgi:mannose/fructose/N-acetylgalactosamine-specific phosphotransferase system component IID
MSLLCVPPDKKKPGASPLWIIVGFFVIGIAGYAVGLLGL